MFWIVSEIEIVGLMLWRKNRGDVDGDITEDGYSIDSFYGMGAADWSMTRASKATAENQAIFIN